MSTSSSTTHMTKINLTCAFCGKTEQNLAKHICGLDALSASDNKKEPARKLASSFEELFSLPDVATPPPNASSFASSSSSSSSSSSASTPTTSTSTSSPSKPSISISAAVPEKKPAPGTADCPVCLLNFPQASIEKHVQDCLNEPNVDNRDELVKSDDKDPELVTDNSKQYLEDQQRHFQLWLERRKLEEIDRKLALKFQAENASNSKSNNNNNSISFAPRPSAPPAVVDDASVARALHEQQVRLAANSASNEERDAKLARELHERENNSRNPNVDDDERLARRLFEEEQQAKAKEDAEKLKRDTEAARLVHLREAELLRQERARVASVEMLAGDAELARRLDQEEKEAERRREIDEQVASARRAAEAEAEAVRIRLEREKQALEQQLEMVREGHQNALNLAGVAYPVEWTRLHGNENHRLVNVQRGSYEWTSVLTQFRVGAPSANVRQILRNQNRSLWTWFYLKRAEIIAKNHGQVNERMLFHGSRKDATSIIVREGFDHRVADLNGALGAGVYFAASSSTSMSYLPRNGHGQRAMLLCRVVLGKVGSGKQGLRRPPEYGGVRCDSVGNLASQFYCVFDDHQI